MRSLLIGWAVIDGAVTVFLLFVFPFVLLKGIFGSTAFAAFSLVVLAFVGFLLHRMRARRSEQIRRAVERDESELLQESVRRRIVRSQVDTT